MNIGIAYTVRDELGAIWGSQDRNNVAETSMSEERGMGISSGAVPSAWRWLGSSRHGTDGQICFTRY